MKTTMKLKRQSKAGELARKRRVKFYTSSVLKERMLKSRPDLLKSLDEQPLRMVVAKNLLRLRNEAGMTREDLAAKASEVGTRTIQRIEEAGEDSNPTSRVIESLAKALGVSWTMLTDPRATVLGLAGIARK